MLDTRKFLDLGTRDRLGHLYAINGRRASDSGGWYWDTPSRTYLQLLFEAVFAGSMSHEKPAPDGVVLFGSSVRPVPAPKPTRIKQKQGIFGPTIEVDGPPQHVQPENILRFDILVFQNNRQEGLKTEYLTASGGSVCSSGLEVTYLSQFEFMTRLEEEDPVCTAIMNEGVLLMQHQDNWGLGVVGANDLNAEWVLNGHGKWDCRIRKLKT
ncbi:MAG: hypothetical protein JSS66_07665 [Armatimonadetes bacterium]|nr:hypothetical protein [Armatimonadota bacterium]